MAGGLKDLKVWQEAVALAGETVRHMRQHTKRETKAVSDMVMLTAAATASLIADGYGRYSQPEQRQVYRAARRELLKLETQLAIAKHAELLSAAAHAELTQRIHSVSRLVGGFLVYLERQLTSEEYTPRQAAPAAN
jgi:four helix bundle protein